MAISIKLWLNLYVKEKNERKKEEERKNKSRQMQIPVVWWLQHLKFLNTLHKFYLFKTTSQITFLFFKSPRL